VIDGIEHNRAAIVKAKERTQRLRQTKLNTAESSERVEPNQL